MAEPELFLLFVRPFNRADIRYMVTGSVAAIFTASPDSRTMRMCTRLAGTS